MKSSRRRRSSVRARSGKLTELRVRLAEAEEALRAIRSGEVDAVVVAAKGGPQVFTLEGAEHAYRVLVESMNEGALTLTEDKTILYANQSFARMVKFPLEQLPGSSIRRFLSAADRAALRPILKRGGKSGAKIQVLLNAADGSHLPAQISIRRLARNGINRAVIGVVVTDMTEARRNEEMLRALTHSVVDVQEAERGHVALDLHDNITQLLCAVRFRSQALAEELSEHDGPAKAEAMKLRDLLGRSAEEVQRISRKLRPSILDHLGLVAALRDTATEFEDRTGVFVKLTCVELNPRLPADTELALYRILQQALKNVETHACARHVVLKLARRGNNVRLTIKDDGLGFDPDRRTPRRNGKNGFGLLGMRERAAHLGGVFRVTSAPRVGTEIDVRIPVPLSGPPRRASEIPSAQVSVEYAKMIDREACAVGGKARDASTPVRARALSHGHQLHAQRRSPRDRLAG